MFAFARPAVGQLLFADEAGDGGATNAAGQPPSCGGNLLTLEAEAASVGSTTAARAAAVWSAS